MGKYLAQRAAAFVGIVFVITVFCFLLVHLGNGDPVQRLLGFGDTPQNRAALEKEFGFNKPLVEQYGTWLWNILHGNLGFQPGVGLLTTRIGSEFKVDLELVVYSQVIAYLVAVPLSVYAAHRPNQLLDQVAGFVTFGLYALPTYVLVVCLLPPLTVTSHIFPGAGSNPFPTGLPWWDALGRNLDVMLLPSLFLSLGSIAVFYRLLRTDMVTTLQEDFITVARSKGLSRRRILWGHALRPSMSGMLASTTNTIALLLTGLFVIELKFGLNGIGYDLVQAISSKEYLLVQGITLVTAVTVVAVAFAVDVVSTLLDPRISRG